MIDNKSKTPLKVTFYMILLSILFAALSVSPKIFAQESKPFVRMVYLYENSCDACDAEGEFVKLYNSIVGEEKEGVEVELLMYNIFHESGEKIADQLFSQYNIPDELRMAPAVFIGGRYLIGTEEIQENLNRAFIEAKTESASNQTVQPLTNEQSPPSYQIEQKADDTHVQAQELIVYFYTSTCKDCKETEEFLNSIKNELPDIKKYNIAEPSGLELIKAYFDAYQVPEDKQSVPIIFFSDIYLSGVQTIKAQLPDKNRNASSLHPTKNLSGKEELKNNIAEALNGYKLLGIIAAGLINGLNPCSISMLLFFLSMLLAQNSSILKMGIVFIAGKLITYFLLGTVLYDILYKFDIPWFQTATKAVLFAFILLIVFLNLRDYIAAKNEDYSKIRLQLPVFLRKYNHRWIKKVIAIRNGKPLLLLCFGLGSLITVGEFLCTGQIYLATIVYVLQNSNSFNIQAVTYFAAYGIAFVTPLLLLTILIHKGYEVFELSEFFREKMHIIKLINTAVFVIFGIIVLVWF